MRPPSLHTVPAILRKTEFNEQISCHSRNCTAASAPWATGYSFVFDFGCRYSIKKIDIAMMLSFRCYAPVSLDDSYRNYLVPILTCGNKSIANSMPMLNEETLIFGTVAKRRTMANTTHTPESGWIACWGYWSSGRDLRKCRVWCIVGHQLSNLLNLSLLTQLREKYNKKMAAAHSAAHPWSVERLP